MLLTDSIVRRAFEAHGTVYASGKVWAVPYHVECWSHAHKAFEQKSSEAFEWIYDQLRRYWQVFRRAGGSPWSPGEAFDRLSSLDGSLRTRRLTELEDRDLQACWATLQSVSTIKPTRAPSVVAISKFLHFWNPRLFVIVDDAVMWQRVLSRSWLRSQLMQEQHRLREVLPEARCPNADPSCDLLSYLAVITLGRKVMRANPNVLSGFVAYVRTHRDDATIDFPLESYEAAAFEWLLLGLAEVPPEGVSL